jgi:hypothetical protein
MFGRIVHPTVERLGLMSDRCFAPIQASSVSLLPLLVWNASCPETSVTVPDSSDPSKRQHPPPQWL